MFTYKATSVRRLRIADMHAAGKITMYSRWDLHTIMKYKGKHVAQLRTQQKLLKGTTAAQVTRRTSRL